MIFRFVTLVLTVIYFCGCASMFSGTTQNFLLRSDIPNTRFYLDGQELGSGTVTVPISKKRMDSAIFIAKAPGCNDASTGIITKFDATSLLGILLDFGIVTILVVDFGITGAIHEAERTNYVLNPTCNK